MPERMRWGLQLTRIHDSKYRMMEFSLNSKRMRATEKIADLSKSIAAIEGLQANPEAAFRYELNDTLYAQARLAERQQLATVHLWLGANVMLSYPVEEALVLLGEKLQEARVLQSRTESDLLFLRDQITTMEVNTARVYNLLMQSVKRPSAG